MQFVVPQRRALDQSPVRKSELSNGDVKNIAAGNSPLICRFPINLLRFWIISGEVSERFKEHAWKACVGETQPWVQIPPSPPCLNYSHAVVLIPPLLQYAT